MSDLEQDEPPFAEQIAQRRFERQFEVLDLSAAAALPHVHADTLRRMAKAGQIPATKVGRAWVFSARLLQDWSEARCSAMSTALPASSMGKSLAERIEQRRREQLRQEPPEMRAPRRILEQHPCDSAEAAEAGMKLRTLMREQR
jgi:excisionase family DNA binding protein